MKKFIITSVLAVLAALMTTVSAQKYPKEYLGLPGDNLNLYAVMDLFRNSPSLEAFERSLNDMDSRINNLDLNRDNRVDYITVTDYRDGRVHTIVLRAVLGRKDFQDVAVITVEKLRKKKVMIQLIGDVALYGRNYIIEPVYSKKHKSKRYIDPVYYGNARVINNYYYDIYDWPVVVYISSPGYSRWSSSYYWGYYPSYWDSWKPYYWDFYYGYHSGWHSHYYSHYHHSDIQRYRGYNDFYYHSIRQESPEVRHRIAEGNYRQTYSRPEQRSEGVALYTRTRSDVNSDVRDRVPAGTRERRDAAPQSVTGTVPNAASETGRRTATESRSENSTGTRADSRTASDATPARRSPATVSNRAPESSVDSEIREARRVSTEAENRASEVRASQERAAESRAAEARESERRSSEARATEQRAVQERAAESRASEQRAAESRASEQRALSRELLKAEPQSRELPRAGLLKQGNLREGHLKRGLLSREQYRSVPLKAEPPSREPLKAEPPSRELPKAGLKLHAAQYLRQTVPPDQPADKRHQPDRKSRLIPTDQRDFFINLHLTPLQQPMNLLFICTINRMRSCTAETIYASNPAFKVKSAGIAPTAPGQITPELLHWADKVFVMENLHRAFITEKFPDIDLKNKLIVLGIPDFYYYMEPELIDLLRVKIDQHLTQ